MPSARLRKRLPAYPLPVLRLARLGVDTRAQGLGIGKALLRHVLALAVEQRGRIGGVGVVTDAKPEAVRDRGCTAPAVPLPAVQPPEPASHEVLNASRSVQTGAKPEGPGTVLDELIASRRSSWDRDRRRACRRGA